MRPQCIAAVEAAAGRTLTAVETRGIEERVRAGMRQAAREDLAAFQALSWQSRLAEGARRAAEELRAQAADAKRSAQKPTGIQDTIGRYLDAWRTAGNDMQDGVDRMILTNNDGRSTVQSLESKVEAVFRDYARRLVTTLEAAHPRMFGLIRNTEGAALLTRELYGEATGNGTMRAAAAEWNKVVDAMVAQFRDAGGVLHRLADWRFPQHHDQARVHAAGRDAWVSAIFPALDRNKYVSENGRLMSDAEVLELLRGAWESIATGGANDITPGQHGSTMRAKRYTDHRVLHFKDAGSWLEYQEAFGSADLWHVMTSHVHRMARDIALLETFGPNPEAMFAFWNDTAVKESAVAKGGAKAQAVGRDLERAYRYMAGQTDGVQNASVAAAFDNARNVLTSARLGSAVISSIPDISTLTATALYNRVSGLETYANSLRALAGTDREALQRAGMMIETALFSLRRMQVDTLGPSFTARLAEATIRVQGLAAWTEGLRSGFAATQMHALSGLTRGKSRLADLDPADAQLLTAHGVTDADIAVWAAAAPEATRFGDLLTPDAIYRVPDAAINAIPQAVNQVTRTPDEIRRTAAQRLLGLTISESHMAVTEPGARERLQMSTDLPRGSIKGELLRSFWQFKSFPWALFQKHMVQRGWGGHDTAGGKAVYIGGLTIASTLLGALAMEVNDMLGGKDPRPLYGADGKIVAKNWIAAFLKGGSAGIYGDFLANEAAPGSSTPIATLLGPLGGMLEDAGRLTIGNAIEYSAGKSVRDSNAGVEAVRMVRGVTPGANLWYAKVALDRLIFNQAMDAMNPDYLYRVRDRAQREFGSAYWWAPQEQQPQRAPNLGAAIGERP